MGSAIKAGYSQQKNMKNLLAVIRAARERGETPVIGLKSGASLLLEDKGRGYLRESLVEVLARCFAISPCSAALFSPQLTWTITTAADGGKPISESEEAIATIFGAEWHDFGEWHVRSWKSCVYPSTGGRRRTSCTHVHPRRRPYHIRSVGSQNAQISTSSHVEIFCVIFSFDASLLQVNTFSRFCAEAALELGVDEDFLVVYCENGAKIKSLQSLSDQLLLYMSLGEQFGAVPQFPNRIERLKTRKVNCNTWIGLRKPHSFMYRSKRTRTTHSVSREMVLQVIPLSSIPDKWLLVSGMLQGSDKTQVGPIHAAHGTLVALKELYYFDHPEWTAIRDKVNDQRT